MEELYDLKAAMESRPPCTEEAPSSFCMIFPNVVELGSFPFGTWKKITREILIDDRKELFAPGHPQEIWSCARRSAITFILPEESTACRSRSWWAPGTIIFCCFWRKYWADTEVWHWKILPIKEHIRSFAPALIRSGPFPMDDSGMRADALYDSGADLAYVMPSHQFPTGIVMPIGRRLELLRWASSGKGGI